MYARRFRLDKDGNLVAERLFCRPLALDPGLDNEARGWMTRRRREIRTAKANAIVGFETASRQQFPNAFEGLARQVHVLMLAVRYCDQAADPKV